VLVRAESAKEYAEYRRLRDQAEWDEFEARKNGGARKLFTQKVFCAVGSIGKSDYSPGMDARVAKLTASKILQCVYGGKGSDYIF
jgi:hypothetical protein